MTIHEQFETRFKSYATGNYHTNMEYLMTSSKVVKFIGEISLREAFDVYNCTTDIEYSYQSPWPKVVVAEVSFCVVVGKSEVYHGIYTADSQNYKESTSKPFVFCCGVLVNHQKCECS